MAFGDVPWFKQFKGFDSMESVSPCDVLCMGFNQDASCVSVGTSKGYRIFNCSPFGRNIFSTEDGGVRIVEMLFCTSLVALVGQQDNCRLKLWNTKTASLICELTFPSCIQAVKLNRKRLIVVLDSQLHIYDLDSMVNLQTLDIPTFCSESTCGLFTPPLCELSPDNNSLLALPQNGVSGDVFLYDALNLVEFRSISAHKTRLSCLKFSSDATLLASASDKGTVIRVFKVHTSEKLFSFRRGSYSASIFSLAFNEVHSMLAASCGTGSIHVFALSSNEEEHETVNDESLLSLAAAKTKQLFAKRPSFAGLLLPNSINEMVEPSRSFAIARLKNHSIVSSCAFVKGSLCVVSSDGKFYQYAVAAGECELEFEISLLGKDEESGGFTTRYFSGKT